MSQIKITAYNVSLFFVIFILAFVLRVPQFVYANFTSFVSSPCPSTYICITSSNLNSYTTTVGASNKKLTINSTLCNSSTCGGVLVSGVTIDTGVNATSVIRIDGVNNVRVEDSTLIGGETGIFLLGSTNVDILNNTIRDQVDVTVDSELAGRGIRFSGVTGNNNVLIQGNSISNCISDGILIPQNDTSPVYNTNVQIINNTIDNVAQNPNPATPSDYGKYHGIYSQAKDILIQGNTVTNVLDGNGISMRSSGTVTCNYVRYIGKAGIDYFADHGKAGGSNLLTIDNNVVYDTGRNPDSCCTLQKAIRLLPVPSSTNYYVGNPQNDTSWYVQNFAINNNSIYDSSHVVNQDPTRFTITTTTANVYSVTAPATTTCSSPTSTPTPVPTPTPTDTPIPTATPVPPTATPIPTATPVPPTATPIPTATPVPPTATPIPTATPVPPTATPIPTATPVPPTATPIPTATPVPPTATPIPTATVVPTSVPTANPTSTSTPNQNPTSTPNPLNGKTSSMGKNGPICSNNNIEVTFDVREDGNARENIEVKFIYSNETKTSKTNSNGRASVSYPYKVNGSISGEPSDGYPSQSVSIEELMSCPTPTPTVNLTPLPTSTPLLEFTGATIADENVPSDQISMENSTPSITSIQSTPSATPMLIPQLISEIVTPTPKKEDSFSLLSYFPLILTKIVLNLGTGFSEFIKTGRVLGENTSSVCVDSSWFSLFLFYLFSMFGLNWMARSQKKKGESILIHIIISILITFFTYSFYIGLNWECVSKWWFIFYYVPSNNFFCNYLPLILAIIIFGTLGFWAGTEEEK